jgi:hypothetical protein
VVIGCKSMITGSAPMFPFEFIIAPRKLQSLGAALQVATKASSVRSTVKIVVSGMSNGNI